MGGTLHRLPIRTRFLGLMFQILKGLGVKGLRVWGLQGLGRRAVG